MSPQDLHPATRRVLVDEAPYRGAEGWVALAFTVPWAIALVLLAPEAWKLTALATAGGLGLSLAMLARLTGNLAQRRGLDPHAWAFLAVVSFGTAPLLLLFFRTTEASFRLKFLCHDCGRLGDATEGFCYGCGAAA